VVVTSTIIADSGAGFPHLDTLVARDEK